MDTADVLIIEIGLFQRGKREYNACNYDVFFLFKHEKKPNLECIVIIIYEPNRLA